MIADPSPLEKKRIGEREAFFNTLYEAHRRVIYAYLLGHVGNADAAADLLQETFLRVWRHLDDARQTPCDRQRYWIFAVARNLVLDHRRRQAVRHRWEAAQQENVASQPHRRDPAHVLIAKEEATAVDTAIANLPDELRLVLTLHLVGEMTSVEIGRFLQRPAGTVRYQILKARRRISKELNQADGKT